MRNSTGANLCVTTIGAICGKYSTKQKTQELVCLRLWKTNHGMALLIWSDLAFQKNLFMWIGL